MSRVVIIDDSPEDREWLTYLSEQIGATEVTTFDSAKPAIKHIFENGADIVLLDYRLNHELGMIHIGAIQARAPDARLILVTGQAFMGLDKLVAKFGVEFLSKDELSLPTFRDAVNRDTA
jgi:DNA-binding NtrC family response regulator